MPGSQVQGDRAVPRGTLPSSAPGKAVLDGQGSQHTPGVDDGQGSLVCLSMRQQRVGHN